MTSQVSKRGNLPKIQTRACAWTLEVNIKVGGGPDFPYKIPVCLY